MIIEGNETEKEAMRLFHQGRRAEGLQLQEAFAAAFRTEYVAIHRAHGEHLPECLAAALR